MVYGLSIWCGGGAVIGTSGGTHGAGERDNERKSSGENGTIWLRSSDGQLMFLYIWYILRVEGGKGKIGNTNLKKKERKGGG